MFHLSESRTSKRLGPKQLPFYSNPEKGPEFEENDPPPLSEGWLQAYSVRYKSKIYHFVGRFGFRWCMHTVKVIYRTRTVGRRQVTVRFMN